MQDEETALFSFIKQSIKNWAVENFTCRWFL